MTSILAHGFGGTDNLPLPRALLAYTLAFVVIVGVLAIRVLVTRPRPRRARRGEGRPAWLFVTARAIGLLLFAGVVVAASIGVDDAAANIAPVTVIVLFFLGLQVVSAVVGDVYWLLDPFDTLARVAPTRDDARSTIDPHWNAAAFLFAFVWFVFAYPEFYPPTPREIAWFIAIYTLTVLVGSLVWGREWVREGEGFGALYGLLARRRARPASTGTVAVLCVYLGSIGFDGVSQTNWWIDVLGNARGWNERAINTVGLVWCIFAVAVVYVTASSVVGRMTERATSDIAVQYAPMLVPLGFALSVAHYLSVFLVDVQNFVALASDPLGRGWDLFGTIDNLVNYRVLTPLQAGWIQTVVVAAGAIASAYVVHVVSFTTFRGRRAVRATYPFAAALVLATVGAVTLLLGT